MTRLWSMWEKLLAGVLIFVLCAGTAVAQGNSDVFRGKLFPPRLILENQEELDLSRDQFTSIREAVVEVQTNVAEHEWDMREAYLRIMDELDADPIDEERVMEIANEALLAENEIKKQQMAMLIRVRNLLTDEQVEYLQSIQGE